MYAIKEISTTILEDPGALRRHVLDKIVQQQKYGRCFVKCLVGHMVNMEETRNMVLKCGDRKIRCEVLMPVWNHKDIQTVACFGWTHQSVNLPPHFREAEHQLLESILSTKQRTTKNLPLGYSLKFHRKGETWEDRDIDAILAMYLEAFPEYVGGNFTTDTVQWLLYEDWSVVIRDNSGTPVGIALADVHRIQNEHGCSFKKGDITEVAVRASERGKGLAQIMYEELLKHLREEKFDLVVSECRAGCAGIISAAHNAGMKYVGMLPSHIPCSSPVWDIGENHDIQKYEDLQVFTACLNQ